MHPCYDFRFSMPGGTESIYYSFDMGPVHFISISTEYYYFTDFGTEQVFSQYNWLIADLEVDTIIMVQTATALFVLHFAS